MWEVTTVAKYDVQGLVWGKLNDQITKGSGISIGTTQLGGPDVTALKF
jgi:hypothetical protein